MERMLKKVRVIANISLSSSLLKLRIERNNISFLPGQHVSLGEPNTGYAREYSIASGTDDPFLEIIFRVIEGGKVSNFLKQLRKDDYVEVGSPIGYFTLNGHFKQQDIYLIATGSGIAPFRSFVKSYPHYSFKIIHGVRSGEDSFARDLNTKHEYILCTSREKTCSFRGRVSDFLSHLKFTNNTLFYLCGNGNMVRDVYRLLRSSGINRNYIYYEEYFN